MRGEYLTLGIDGSAKAELPPRARRIHQVENLLSLGVGTTSACAENTFGGLVLSPPNGNYLRVRGEYVKSSSSSSLNQELPPRARRILSVSTGLVRHPGTTSACAENTWPARLWRWSTRNYLRVRGEYTMGMVLLRPHQELPPRARRIRILYHATTNISGTTSACAENTDLGQGHVTALGNYLRVRGEYFTYFRCKIGYLELPPRARRILHLFSLQNRLFGTTSACAENTLNELGLL